MSDYIKKLAIQAGMEWDTHIWCWLANPPHLERFAELVRADEREACAKLCDELAESSSDHEAGAALNIRETIRARGEK